MARTSFSLALVALCGCYHYTPPGPPTPHDAKTVYASFGKTWDAVIDVFAAQNIPIRTMERVSGFIAAERTSWTYASLYDRDNVLRMADCGHSGPTVYLPSEARYNVVVRGDSSTSSVKVTTTYTSSGAFYTNPTKLGPTRMDCSSRGAFEDSVEATVKQRAEALAAMSGGRPASAPMPTAPRVKSDTSGVRPLNVTVRLRFVDPDSSITAIPDLLVAVISEQGDTTTARTNGLGVANFAVTAGRYHVVPLRPVDFEGKRYQWDVPFIVRMGMAPVDLSQRNAKVSAVPR